MEEEELFRAEEEKLFRDEQKSESENKRGKRNAIALIPARIALSKPALGFLCYTWFKNIVSLAIESLKESFKEEEMKKNTTTGENVKEERTLITAQYADPKDAVERKTRALKRSKRVAPLVVAGGKIVGWTIGMALAGTVAAVGGAYASEKFAEKRLTEVKRAQIDCTSNNAGCIENRCYTNCGPRMLSSDWCFKLVECNISSDCDPCWPCASTCFFGDINRTMVQNADVENNNNNEKNSNGDNNGDNNEKNSNSENNEKKSNSNNDEKNGNKKENVNNGNDGNNTTTTSKP